MTTTAYERVLDALDAAGMKVQARGDKSRAQCPVHGSRGLTLSIRRREDKTSVKCFADCAYDDILAELGLTRRELFDGDLPRGYTPPPRPKPSPWDALTAPGIEHVLTRMVREQSLEADPGLRVRARAQGDDCPLCREGVA
jgi:hypothetical protein